MFGRTKEVIFINKRVNKKEHCYEVELMSGTKRRYFSKNRDDETLKHGLDAIYGLEHVKTIIYLGMRYSE